MNLRSAQNILREDYNTMPIEKLQRYRVRLIDALYHADGSLGMNLGVAEGFYKILESESASGYVPADMWLVHNLEWTLKQVRQRERKLLGLSEHEYKYGKEEQ